MFIKVLHVLSEKNSKISRNIISEHIFFNWLYIANIRKVCLDQFEIFILNIILSTRLDQLFVQENYYHYFEIIIYNIVVACYLVLGGFGKFYKIFVKTKKSYNAFNAFNDIIVYIIIHGVNILLIGVKYIIEDYHWFIYKPATDIICPFW